jgi:hypothetical protein
MTQTIFTTLEAVPIPTGPCRIGTMKYDLEDIYRKDFNFPNGRLIPIQIYFPLDRGLHTLDSKIFEKRALIGPWEPLQMKVYSKSADLSSMVGNNFPIILLNHASYVPLSDYSFIAEDLASHGNVVISIQHDLISDEPGPSFWEGSSCSRNAKVIDNLLYVFEWLKTTQVTLFQAKINLKRIGLIGHSLGANSLLLWVNRTLDILYKDTRPALFSREDQQGVQECLILMEPTRFSFPMNNRYPLFFLFAEEREDHQKQTGCSNQMIQAGHQVNYYKGSTHISFMDHGYICPPRLFNPNEYYFNGTLEERKAFFDKIRKDIRSFLGKHLQAPPSTFKG